MTSSVPCVATGDDGPSRSAAVMLATTLTLTPVDVTPAPMAVSHPEGRHTARLFAAVLPAWLKVPPMTRRGCAALLGSGQTIRLVTLPLMPPPSKGCHCTPSHHARWLMAMPLAVVKFPPARSRAGNGPLPSGSHATAALTLPLKPEPKVPQVEVLGV